MPDSQPDSPDRVDALVHAQAYLRGRERYVAETATPDEQTLLDRLDPYAN